MTGLNSNGLLEPCPSKPNCVSTTAQDEQHKMDPIPFTGEVVKVMAAIRRVCLNEPRVTLETEKKQYLHFTFKSRLLGFIDDVEFQINPSDKLIHFRSASRLGYSDLGVNRERMELLTKKIKATLLKP